LVGFILVSALASVGATTKSWQTTSDLADGTTLARQLLNEISCLAYQEPLQTPTFGLESGETLANNARTGFDDLDDYKDFTDTPPRDRSGLPITNYASWQRIADVQKLKETDKKPSPDGGADKGLRLITVTVTSPQGKVTTLQAMRSLAGGTQQPQGVGQTIVNWVGCELQAGSASKVSAAVSLVNHATDQ
jgi:hypothetical protein